jgi:O-antigen/teichoic acid export membrane protein
MNPVDNLLGRSVKAMGWSYSGVVGNVMLQVVASVLFARVLGAHITGVFAFGLLVFPPFRFLSEFGLGSALIQRAVLDGENVRSAYSRSVVLAVLAAAAWLVCIRGLAASMHQEQDAPALNCLALALLCLPLQTICGAVLTKRLEQKYLQVVSLVSYAAGYLAVGAYGALHDWGVWSLTLGFAAQNVIATVMLAAHTRTKLRLRFHGEAGFMWRFGSHATAINVSNWLTSSLDNMAVAWFFGTTTLGLYSVAYTLVRTPADRVVTSLQNVLFPASVLVREDKERLAKGCIATIDAVFILTAPAFCAVAVLAGTIVQALYGNSWYKAALVLPPLAVSMIFHCLTVITSALLWGIGGVKRDMRLQWCSAALLLVAVIIAARSSFVAVAWVVLPVTVIRAVWGLVALAAIAGIGVRRMLRGFASGAVLVTLVTPALTIIDLYLRSEMVSALARLICEMCAGGGLWAGIAALLRTRFITPELQAGLQSLRVSLGRNKSHA